MEREKAHIIRRTLKGQYEIMSTYFSSKDIYIYITF